MTIVDVMAIIGAGTVLIAWQVYRLYQIVYEIDDELTEFREGIADKLNELIEQCNANTISIARMREHKPRTNKNDGHKTQG